MTKPILIVEDDLSLQETYADFLGEEFTVYSARTLREAKRLFNLHRQALAAVIMDACVPGHVPNTLPLVRHMRACGFRNPILATSSDPDFQDQQMNAGCSHRCAKTEATGLLRKLLIQ